MSGLAAEAAAHWGGSADLRLVAERENAVYAAQLPGGRAALRLHRAGYQSAEAIRSELWWCAALADAGVTVPRALPARDGALLHRLADGRLASAIAWVEGTAWGRAGEVMAADRGDLDHRVAQFHAVGGMLAAFHTATDGLVLPEWFDRPSWDIDGLLGEAPLWGRWWEHPGLTASEAALLRATRDHLRTELDRHRMAGGDFGLVHADVLRENVLLAGDTPWLIDFDDSGFGFRGYDLGTVLSQCLSEPFLRDLASALVAGYVAQRPLVLDLIPAFTLARCCASVGWAMSRLPPDHPVQRSHIDRVTGLARSVLDGGPNWWV